MSGMFHKPFVSFIGSYTCSKILTCYVGKVVKTASDVKLMLR